MAAVGAWGVRWISELSNEDLDPHLLMWDIRRTIPIDDWPRRRTVIAFEFTGVSPDSARWWLSVNGDEADVCDRDPGFDVAATVRTSLRILTEIWRGDRGWLPAVKSGEVSIAGPAAIRNAIPTWIGQGDLAAVERPHPTLVQ